MKNRSEQTEEIIGYIERITFHNPESGYTIAQLKQPKHSELTCIVGTMPEIQPGETIRCFGNWKKHLIHGLQFEIARYRTEAPADVMGIIKYLGSGLIKGIGPKYAKRIVDLFGDQTLNIIDQTPERLLEIEGLGKKRAEQIQSCWSEQKSVRDVMVFLQTYDVSPSYAQKIFKKYGDQSIKKVKENPFNLARDIFGIGFKTADTIAAKLGIAKDAPQRIDSGIEFVLSELSSDGHVCFPVEEFLPEAESILQVSQAMIKERMTQLKEESRVEIGELLDGENSQTFIWLKFLFFSEVGIAKEIRKLVESPCDLRSIDVEKAIDWVQKKLQIQLAENQKLAVAQSLKEKFQIITGGPGTGKSTITKAILAITEKITSKIVLAAPTGRAAKRMTEITGKKASTIHSLLEYNFHAGAFKRNRENPLEGDLFIIDEASMIDTMLMFSLLKAIPAHARVILVGDIDQLPSVGPGNVLKDIIASRRLSVTMLNEIFRQASGSRIITNAHKIKKGYFPDITNLSHSDFFFMENENPEELIQNILDLVKVRLPTKYGFDSFNDIQVLSPMRKGIIGIENLNSSLQNTLNPSVTPLYRSGRRFHAGDKVMQTRNDYKREVYNGDIGSITKIDPASQQIIVSFYDREVIYDYTNLDELVLAYAVSVHKYQGSECPCIIMPVHTSHFKLLYRNLLYTGVTRGKQLVILIGTKKALAIAIKNDGVQKRYSGLQHALTGQMKINYEKK
jgi:exodeoxyribonuclease V alpha subunit